VSVTCEVDPGLHDALVPSFVLQPLVENAFEHGLGESGTGTIGLAAEADGETLILSVTDDGSGTNRTSNGHGVGLANTRRRLEELYGERASLALFTRPDDGTTVEIRMPLSFEAVTR
jgi:sensor histidine kinase YesM